VPAKWQNCWCLLPSLSFLDCVFRYKEKSTDAAIRARPHQKSISSRLGSYCLLELNLWNLEQETSLNICTLDRNFKCRKVGKGRPFLSTSPLSAGSYLNVKAFHLPVTVSKSCYVDFSNSPFYLSLQNLKWNSQQTGIRTGKVQSDQDIYKRRLAKKLCYFKKCRFHNNVP
jgi:hypothetical protein